LIIHDIDNACQPLAIIYCYAHERLLSLMSAFAHAKLKR